MNFIAGEWVAATSGGRTRDCIDPASGNVIATVDEASPEDARRAVLAARATFDAGDWPETAVAVRSSLLSRIADLLERDKEELARIETLDTGKTLVESRIDIDDVVSVFRYYARLALVSSDRVVDVGDPAVVSRIVREPIGGVCVLIAPWNYPLLQISWKVAPALAAGCTMVLKPSEVTPLSTIAFARLIEEAGVPAGVVNLVQGSGADLGPALTDTGDVDFISFTGGLATGTTILETAAKHVTKVAVELGGKNPHIVFADAEWESSVDQVLTGVFLHSGQVCSAGTRLIVEESIADDFVAALVSRAEAIRVGPGLDPGSETGPLVSAAQRDKIEAYVALGISEGATLRTGGSRPADPALDGGSYYLPTIFDHCDRSMRIVQEETFGPILTVERFTTEEDAVRLATTPSTVSPPESGRRTPPGANGWCAACATGPCGSTTSATTRRRRNGADSRSPATAANSDPPGSPNTRKSNTSGTTRPRLPRVGSPRPDVPRQGARAGPLNFSGSDRMTSTDNTTGDHDSGLEDFGYKESLDRSIGKFASFAAGVSYISILTGTFQLFYFGFGTAGPAYLWSWPLVFVGQLAVALCFMELAAKYPIAGSVYNWAKTLGSRIVGVVRGLADAHRVDRHPVGGCAGAAAQPAAAVERLPDRR